MAAHLAVVQWTRVIGLPEYIEIIEGSSEQDATHKAYEWGRDKQVNFGVYYLGERERA